MAKKFASEFSSNGSAAAADKLLIQKASDSTVNYILISDLFSGTIGAVINGASSPAVSITGVGTNATVGLKFAAAYLGHTIVTGTYASAVSNGVTLTSTNDYNAAFLADDAGANIGASVRNLLGRTYLGQTQSAGTIRSVMGQLKVADTKDLGTGVYTAVQAYLELVGATSVKTGGKVSGLDVSVEMANGKTCVVDSGGYFAGVKIELTTGGTATFTQTGNSAAVYIDKVGTITDWKVGVDVNNCTTGIDIGASTTGINLAGAITTGIAIAATALTDGILISGTTPVDGLHISSACSATGINLSGASVVGISITGAGTTPIAISNTFSGNGIDFSGCTYVPTGSAGPALIRAGTYDVPLTNSATAQSGLVRLYMETSADGSSYDRAVFSCLKTTGTKGIITTAGLAEVLADATGPANVKGCEFICDLHATGSNLPASAIMFGGWFKVTAIDGATINSTAKVAPLWLDNQLYGANANGALEYSIWNTTGGNVPKAWAGFGTTSAGWANLLYFDSTMAAQSPIVTSFTGNSAWVPGSKGTFTQCGQIKILINTTQFYIPFGTVA